MGILKTVSFVLLLAACARGLVSAGEPGPAVSLAGTVDAKAFEPGRDYRLTLDVKAASPTGLHLNAEAPLRARVRASEGFTVRSADQVGREPRLVVVFRAAKAATSARFDVAMDLPLCDEKAEVCLLEQVRWTVSVADGEVTVGTGKRGEAALEEGKVRVGDPAPTEGCVARDVDGRPFELRQAVGTKPLVLFTYRAFW
jgi:hypothetical protein